MFTKHVHAWFLKQTPFMGNASGNLWEEPSQAPHCHTSIVQRHVTAGDSHHHSAGAHVPTGKPGELQTAATPLGTFSRKDYTDLTWCACSSPPALKTDILPALHPPCLKKCLFTSESRVPLSCTTRNKFLQGSNDQLRDGRQLLPYPYKRNSSNAIYCPLSSTVEFVESTCCTLSPPLAFPPF